MAKHIATGGVHHLRLTVTDVDRARVFYTGLLGFQVAMELPSGVLLSNGSVLLGIGPAPDPERAISGDRFDENRVGLDHLSFSLSSRDELEQADRHGHSAKIDPASRHPPTTVRARAASRPSWSRVFS